MTDEETVWISPAETAELLGLARSTVNRWRQEGKGPAFRKVGETARFVVYDRDVVLEFLRKYGPFPGRKKPERRSA